ncbi:MAG: hypothetical protein H6835_09030 [Planctomycetes bacterium]|nr:hypothetical protein [Planctomycetota bacterium]
MHRPHARLAAAFVWGLCVASSCLREPEREIVDVLFSLDARAAAPSAGSGLQPLGARLFERAGCAQCHAGDALGTDGEVHGRATPPLADVARQLVFGWDGDVGELEAFVRRELVQRAGLGDDAAVRALDDAANSLDDAAVAIVAHLSTMRSRGRWDRYVEGDAAALTAGERDGLVAFVEAGCATCHAGRNLGGRSVHVLGLAEPLPGREPRAFRAPMLRHAARTGPYLHDHSIARLDDAVRLMARHELGRTLADDDVRAIVTFLHATTETD